MNTPPNSESGQIVARERALLAGAVAMTGVLALAAVPFGFGLRYGVNPVQIMNDRNRIVSDRAKHIADRALTERDDLEVYDPTRSDDGIERRTFTTTCDSTGAEGSITMGFVRHGDMLEGKDVRFVTIQKDFSPDDDKHSVVFMERNGLNWGILAADLKNQWRYNLPENTLNFRALPDGEFDDEHFARVTDDVLAQYEDIANNASCGSDLKIR